MTEEEALRALRSLVRDFSRNNWTHLTFVPWYWKPRRHGMVWEKRKLAYLASRSYLDQPHRWNEIARVLGIRFRVFYGSMMDWAEDREDLDPWRLQLWRLIEQTPFLDWILLTKRSAQMREWVSLHGLPPNVVLGISVKNQRAAEERVHDLLRALQGRPNVGMISVEPLLGPVDLTCIGCDRDGIPGTLDALGGTWWPAVGDPDLEHRGRVEGLARIGWVVGGGESGEHARPWHPSWARGLALDCEEQGTPFLWRQNGEWMPAAAGAPCPPALILDLDGKTYSDRPAVAAHVRDTGNIVPSPYPVIRVGKLRAGRDLDGTFYDAFPPGMSAQDLSHLLSPGASTEPVLVTP